MNYICIIDTKKYSFIEKLKLNLGIMRPILQTLYYMTDDINVSVLYLPDCLNIKPEKIEKYLKAASGNFLTFDEGYAILTENAKKNDKSYIIQKYFKVSDGKELFIKLLEKVIKKLIKICEMDIQSLTVSLCEKDVSYASELILRAVSRYVRYATLYTPDTKKGLEVANNIFDDIGFSVFVTNNIEAARKSKIVVIIDENSNYLKMKLAKRGQIIITLDKNEQITKSNNIIINNLVFVIPKEYAIIKNFRIDYMELFDVLYKITGNINMVPRINGFALREHVYSQNQIIEYAKS